MSSKQHILHAIRQHPLEPLPPPTLDREWITYPDPRQQFAETLAAVGGRCVRADDLDAVHRELWHVPAYAEARQIVSLVPGVGESSVDWEAIDDPHALRDVDFAVLPGQLAVAENAAVWVTDERVKHRVVYFLAQHLALVVPASEVVDNLHQAYKRLCFPVAKGKGGQTFPPDANDLSVSNFGCQAGKPDRQESIRPAPPFGTFISGPSKTADIEQSLVIGAHGARSLVVFLVDKH